MGGRVNLSDSWPFDNSGQTASGSEALWVALMSGLGADGVIKTGNVIDESPSGSAGAHGSKLTVYADGSGMTVFVALGRAIVRGQLVANPTDGAALSITAAPGGSNSRIDLVVVGRDLTNNQGYIAVNDGVAAASPVAPTPTRTTTVWEIPLALITVGTGVTNIAAGNVTDNRQYTVNRVSTRGTADTSFAGGAAQSNLPVGASGNPVMQVALTTDGRPVQVQAGALVSVTNLDSTATFAVNVAGTTPGTSFPNGQDFAVGEVTQQGGVSGWQTMAHVLDFNGDSTGLALLPAGRYLFTFRCTPPGTSNVTIRAARYLVVEEQK